MRPLHIVYVADTRLPTQKAHGLALMKLCEAFAKAGARVEVVAPRLLRLSKKDPYEYYGVERLFPIVRVASLDLHPLRVFTPLLYLLQMVTFCVSALWYCARHYRGAHVVYFSHDYMPLYFLSFLRAPIYYDIHHFPGRNFMYRRVLRCAAGFAVQTKWKVGELQKRFGIPAAKIVYWPNGTDVAAFGLDTPLLDARRAVGLPIDGHIALYVGQFFAWKGVDVLLKAAALLPPDTRVVLVGGSEEDTRVLQRTVPESAHVLFVPFQPRELIPQYLRAADVVVLPNTAKQKVSAYYTSPMKLFEYLASGRPLVASDLPSIREIVGDAMAFFATPDSPTALAEAISRALSAPDAAQKAARARSEVLQYTWSARAAALLPHIQAHA